MMPSGYVVLYRFSTSNHNRPTCRSNYCQLYYIVSLHQTTTKVTKVVKVTKLYYIVSLHQTTTRGLKAPTAIGCIISFLYIKPQLAVVLHAIIRVVLYRFSTSNHNSVGGAIAQGVVVLYRFSTSNHNSEFVVGDSSTLYYIVSLHQTTTPRTIANGRTCCIISFLYIKPQPQHI